MNVCSAYNHHNLPVNPFFVLQITHGRKFFQNTENFGATVNDRFLPVSLQRSSRGAGLSPPPAHAPLAGGAVTLPEL